MRILEERALGGRRVEVGGVLVHTREDGQIQWAEDWEWIHRLVMAGHLRRDRGDYYVVQVA